MAKTPNLMLATLFALIAAFTFAITGVLVKLIGTEANTVTVVFFRFFIGLIILLPWFLKDKNLFKINKPTSFIVRSIAGLLALFCMFYAVKYISLANALLLSNTNALFVPIVAWIMLRTHTPFKIWIAIIIGFLGVIFILRPDKHLFDYAAFIGLCAGLFGGVSLVQIRQMTKVSSSQQILFFYFLTGTIIPALFLPFIWQTPTVTVWLLLIAVGIVSIFYQLFATLAFTYAPVRLMSAVMFATVAFGALFDWLLWNNVPDLLTAIGIFLVIIGGITAVIVGQKTLMASPK